MYRLPTQHERLPVLDFQARPFRQAKHRHTLRPGPSTPHVFLIGTIVREYGRTLSEPKPLKICQARTVLVIVRGNTNAVACQNGSSAPAVIGAACRDKPPDRIHEAMTRNMLQKIKGIAPSDKEHVEPGELLCRMTVKCSPCRKVRSRPFVSQVPSQPGIRTFQHFATQRERPV